MSYHLFTLDLFLFPFFLLIHLEKVEIRNVNLLAEGEGLKPRSPFTTAAAVAGTPWPARPLLLHLVRRLCVRVFSQTSIHA